MRRLALHSCLVIVVLAALVAAGTVSASPQPIRVCGACGDSFEDVASEEGIEVDVANSTATVYVHENASATWVVTNRIDRSAADAYEESPAALERVSRTAAKEGRGLPYDSREASIEFLSASVDGRNLTLRFRENPATERHFGLTVVDTLHSDGVRSGWLLNADRFTIVGPPGTELVNEPSEPIDADAIPEIDGRNVTWYGPATDWGEFVHEDIYLVYGPPDASESRVRGAVAFATAPIWIDNVQTYVFPGVGVYGVILVGVAVAVRKAGRRKADRLGVVVAGLGLLGVVGAAVAQAVHEPAWFGGVSAVYLVTGATARYRPDRFRSVRGALGVAALSVVAAGLALSAVDIYLRPGSWPSLRPLRQAVYHLPVAIAPAFGLAVARAVPRRDAREFTRAFGGAALSFLVAGVVLVPVATRPFGVIILYTVGGALVSGVAAGPLAVLAARLWADH